MVTIGLPDNRITFLGGIMVTVKVTFGSTVISSSLIGMLMFTSDWPAENLMVCDTAV